MAKDKARYFTFLLYPESIPADWKQRLELIGVPIAISPLHDRDKAMLKDKHTRKLIITLFTWRGISYAGECKN